MLRRPLLASWTFASTVALGCGTDNPAPADAASDRSDATADAVPKDTAPSACTTMFPPFEPGAMTGAAEPLAAPMGQARAGRLRAEDLPRDRTGLLLWSAGDFVLANQRVALVVEDVGASALYNPWGGGIVGLGRVSGGRLVEPADFNESISGLGRFTLEAATVRVLRDGSAGGPAVVRAVGVLKAIPFIEDFARPLAPGEYRGIPAAVDYELAPDSDHVDITWSFTNTSNDDVSVPTVIHTFFQRYRMPLFNPVTGFDSGALYAPDAMGSLRSTPFVAFVDHGATSYAWSSPDSNLTPLLFVSGFDAFTSRRFALPACAQTRRPFARITLGGPGLDGLRVALARDASQTLREVRGTVRDAGGMPAANVNVHATSADGRTYLTRATTDAAGAFILHVPNTDPVRLVGWREGENPTAPVDVAASATTAMLSLGPSGSIRVRASEMGREGTVPARVQVVPAAGDPPSLGDLYGERSFGNRRLHIAFPTNGEVTLPAPPGRYQVTVSRGPEYEVVGQEVTVTEGMTATADAVLRRSVSTPNVQCGDFHIHTSRSPDSRDPSTFKLAAAAADGLEIAARSDHEFVADWADEVRSLGLSPWVFGFSSLELTTFVWGHFGVVPLTPDPTRPNGGIFDWVGRRPPEVFAEVRARASAPAIIINHPRGGGAAGAYFDAARYDPVTGVAAETAMWDSMFTLVEVFNDSDFEENRLRAVRDWFSFLNRGRRVFAVGSSDSHGIHPNSPVGYPRTCMTFTTDDPSMLSPNVVRDSLAAGRSYISGGIYLDVQGPAGQGPGQTVMGAGAEARLRVTVQAPSWVDVSRLDLYVDTADPTVTPRQTVMLTDAQRDPTNPVVRYRGELTVPVATGGSWAVVVASGARDLAPVHPGKRPFAVSNPVFFQR